MALLSIVSPRPRRPRRRTNSSLVRFRRIAKYGYYRPWSDTPSTLEVNTIYVQEAISNHSPAEV